jgi:hypothetical protein
MAKPVENYAPAETTAFIIGEVNAIAQGIAGHDVAAVTSAVLGLLPALITLGVRLWRAGHPAT